MGIAAIAGAIAEPSTLAAMFGFTPILLGPAGQELMIDVLESEAPEYSFEITSDPVECGSEISDHIFEKPSSLTLDIVLTDFQFSAKNIISGILNGNLSLATWYDKKDALYKIKDAKQLVNASTPMHFYQNYLIESISPSASAQSGNCFRCRVVLRSVNIVASLIGYIDPSLLPVELQSATKNASKKTQGAQNKGAAQTGESGKSATSVGNTGDAYGNI